MTLISSATIFYQISFASNHQQLWLYQSLFYWFQLFDLTLKCYQFYGYSLKIQIEGYWFQLMCLYSISVSATIIRHPHLLHLQPHPKLTYYSFSIFSSLIYEFSSISIQDLTLFFCRNLKHFDKFDISLVNFTFDVEECYGFSQSHYKQIHCCLSCYLYHKALSKAFNKIILLLCLAILVCKLQYFLNIYQQSSILLDTFISFVVVVFIIMVFVLLQVQMQIFKIYSVQLIYSYFLFFYFSQRILTFIYFKSPLHQN